MTIPFGMFKPVRDPSYSSTILLLHGDGTNGSTTFTDNAATTSALTLAGNTTISTSRSKFGGSSIFTGGAGYLASSNTTYWDLGTGDYCVEFWLNINSWPATNAGGILDMRTTATGNEPMFQLVTSGSLVRCSINNVNYTLQSGASLNTWYHVVQNRISGVAKGWLNGVVRTGNITQTQNLTAAQLTLGTFWDQRNTSTGWHANAYLDDIRITKGAGRYSANFTPPTTPFPNS